MHSLVVRPLPIARLLPIGRQLQSIPTRNVGTKCRLSFPPITKKIKLDVTELIEPELTEDCNHCQWSCWGNRCTILARREELLGTNTELLYIQIDSGMAAQKVSVRCWQISLVWGQTEWYPAWYLTNHAMQWNNLRDWQLIWPADPQQKEQLKFELKRTIAITPEKANSGDCIILL